MLVKWRSVDNCGRKDWAMQVKDLRLLLEQLDDNLAVCVSVDFPNLEDWSVLSGDVGWTIDEDTGEFKLLVSVYLADFDYPSVLADLKRLVAEIPESAIA
jgi:hypothetical protein